MNSIIKQYNLLLLIFMAAVISTAGLQAAQRDRSPGAYIPTLKNTHSGEFTNTRWVSAANGAYLEVRASREDTWHALEQTLANLGIKPLRKDPSAGEWLTDWVVWKYDKKTGKTQSKPGFSFKSQNLERHRFLFTLKADDSTDRVKIVATDITRQREVDIAPDSESFWMEWKDRYTQQEAADTFLQRLQLPIQSALATRFVVSKEIVTGKDGVAVVAETGSRTDADVVLITIPGAGATTVPQPVQEVRTPAQPAASTAVAVPDRVVTTAPLSAAETPALSPAVTERVTRKGMITPDYSTKPLKDVPAESAVATGTLAPPVPTRAKTVTAVAAEAAAADPDHLAFAPEEPQTTAPSKNGQVMTGQPVAVPEPAATNGLLVRATPGVTWPALLQSLKDLDIAIEQIDERQHILLTGWVDANYDGKKQLLVMQFNDKPLWAFSLFGRGVERHRFQLVMVPANQGTRAIVYAYHIGSQEQVDLTPDSSQTVLSWEDRETSADVALALLRRLRIIIPH